MSHTSQALYAHRLLRELGHEVSRAAVMEMSSDAINRILWKAPEMLKAKKPEPRRLTLEEIKARR